MQQDGEERERKKREEEIKGERDTVIRFPRQGNVAGAECIVGHLNPKICHCLMIPFSLLIQ